MEVNLYDYATEGVKRRLNVAKEASDIIIRTIGDKEEVDKIILYGRTAKNEWREGTDTDILIVFKRKIGLEGFAILEPEINTALDQAGSGNKDLHIEQCSFTLFNNPPENAHVMKSIKEHPYVILYENS